MGSISDPLCSPTHEIPNNAVVPVSSINISLSRRSFILDWRCSAHTRRAPTTSARSVSIASSVLFKAELLHAQNRESGAGCTVSAFSASRRAASSGIVISPSARPSQSAHQYAQQADHCPVAAPAVTVPPIPSPPCPAPVEPPSPAQPRTAALYD